MSMEDPWADVFAKAEGCIETSSLLPSRNEDGGEKDDANRTRREPSSPAPTKSKRSKKRRRRNSNDTNAAQSLSWRDHLKARSKYTCASQLIQQKSRSLLILKESLLGGQCEGWNFGAKNRCGSCGLPSFRHCAESSRHFDQHSWPRNFYSTLRNIRYSAVICIVDDISVTGTRWTRYHREMELWRKAFNQGQMTWPSLDSPWCDLLQVLAQLKEKSKSDLVVSKMLELIMLCDTCYYEIYYADLTHSQYGKSEPDFIPHPTVYFGEVYESGELQKVLEATSLLKGMERVALEYYNFSNESILEDNDALTALHTMRFLETLIFFHRVRMHEGTSITNHPKNWLSGATNGRSATSRHETPAPDLLRKWRDSCRDYMTHLYGYATLPPSHIEEITRFSASCTILELGAGTGYLCHLLGQRGAKVRALDAAPTSADVKTKKRGNDFKTNEYHAATPEFTLVEQGDVDKLRTIMKQRSLKERDPYILLLAYPPPDSEMGYLAVKSFVEMGGTKLVHIGEVQGLTGTRKLEVLLAKFGTEIKSISCPTWGTDAAKLSFWSLKQTPRPSLLPLIWCANCKTSPGSQRLRIMRYLHYCSEKCWHDHRQSRAFLNHLICSSLGRLVSVDDLCLHDPIHFSHLAC